MIAQTTLGDQDLRVSTTEHLLATLQGFGVDNTDIELDAWEVPIMDGSAVPFFGLMKKTGKKKQDGLRKVLRITKPVTTEMEIRQSLFHPATVSRSPARLPSTTRLTRPRGTASPSTARARTFGYVEQVEDLWANSLALGGTLDNVIAIHWNRKSVLNMDGLSYEDEFIRHKVLDLIGDLPSSAVRCWAMSTPSRPDTPSISPSCSSLPIPRIVGNSLK